MSFCACLVLNTLYGMIMRLDGSSVVRIAGRASEKRSRRKSRKRRERGRPEVCK